MQNDPKNTKAAKRDRRGEAQRASSGSASMREKWNGLDFDRQVELIVIATAAAATLIYACVAIWQLHTMNETLTQVKGQLTAQITSNEIAKSIQRARLTLGKANAELADIVTVDGNVNVRAFLRNSGQVPALNVEDQAWVAVTPPSAVVQMDFDNRALASSFVVPAGAVYPVRIGLTAEQARLLDTSQVQIIVRVRYRDDFGGHYCEGLCAMRWGGQRDFELCPAPSNTCVPGPHGIVVSGVTVDSTKTADIPTTGSN